MMSSISKPISSQIQAHFNPPSISHKNSLIPSQSHQFNLVKPINLIKTRLNSPPKASTSGFCTTSSEETLYDLLGISASVPLSEIKSAYKQMALKYHPDVSPPERADEYTTRFIRVQEAYETLSDPEARAMYDSCMAKGLHLAFSGKAGSRFQARSDEKQRWKTSWEAQVNELKRRSAVDEGGRMSWSARVRKQRSGNGLSPGEYGSG
ncbi:dnaJ domain-containing protein [Artemisia annua]|uniref:DnaJ domain-containing protein n=1 Tax=Artemisia annua TaxID=35608 RepID=A0A2U1LRK4_ARTAN|nr:dnaJ domain-containing protein [Artemisia annua]